MTQALFITGTAAGVGKSTAAQAIIAALQDAGYDAAYYKPIVSGTDSIPESDAGQVRTACSLEQDVLSTTSYVFKEAVSPHLAAAHLLQPVDVDMIRADFSTVALLHDVTIVEGSGGIICPFTLLADGRRVMQEDVVQTLGLTSVIVADSGVGTLNATLLTLAYMRQQELPVAGVILNRFDADNEVHQDNLAVIERLGEVDVVATIADGGAMTVRKPFFLLETEESR